MPIWEEKGRCTKLAIFFLNFFFFLTSLAATGVGIWLVADKFEISELLGSPLYLIFVIAFIVMGIGCCVVSFFAWYGALTEKTKYLKIFIGCMIALIIITVCVILMSAFFREELSGQLKSSMSSTMSRTLSQDYGMLTTERHWNAMITDMWDAVQRKLNCCAVEDQGWEIYRHSRWFLNTSSGFRPSERNYVPQSCCKIDSYSGYYLNLRYCQNLQSAPPNVPTGGRNRFIHYDGCFKKGYQFVSDRGWIIFGMGLFMLIMMIMMVILAYYMNKWIKEYREEHGLTKGERIRELDAQIQDGAYDDYDYEEEYRQQQIADYQQQQMQPNPDYYPDDYTNQPQY